jgi:CRISPR-associated protein Cas2
VRQHFEAARDFALAALLGFGFGGRDGKQFAQPRVDKGFVGKMSATVRDKLWELVCKRVNSGGAALLYSSPTEQGFTVRTHGERSRELVDYEGLMLVRVPKKSKDVDKAEQTA